MLPSSVRDLTTCATTSHMYTQKLPIFLQYQDWDLHMTECSHSSITETLLKNYWFSLF